MIGNEQKKILAPGDKVLIKTWEDMRHEYPCKNGAIVIPGEYPGYFTYEMRKYCNEIMTIQSVFVDGYRLKEDDENYVFTNGMFVRFKICSTRLYSDREDD